MAPHNIQSHRKLKCFSSICSLSSRACMCLRACTLWIQPLRTTPLNIQKSLFSQKEKKKRGWSHNNFHYNRVECSTCILCQLINNRKDYAAWLPKLENLTIEANSPHQILFQTSPIGPIQNIVPIIIHMWMLTCALKFRYINWCISKIWKKFIQ